jgi:hypothetical protein
MKIYVLSKVIRADIHKGNMFRGDVCLMAYLLNQSYDSNQLVMKVYSKGWANLFLICNLIFQHNLNLALYGTQMELRPFYHTKKLMYNTIDNNLLRSKSRDSSSSRETTLLAGGSGFDSKQEFSFSLLFRVQTGARIDPACCTKGGSFPVDKAA